MEERAPGCTCRCPCHEDPEHGELYHAHKAFPDAPRPPCACEQSYPTEVHHSCPAHNVGEVRGFRDRWR